MCLLKMADHLHCRYRRNRCWAGKTNVREHLTNLPRPGGINEKSTLFAYEHMYWIEGTSVNFAACRLRRQSHWNCVIMNSNTDETLYCIKTEPRSCGFASFLSCIKYLTRIWCNLHNKILAYYDIVI